jgi:MSHA biogenesis protein MshQ
MLAFPSVILASVNTNPKFEFGTIPGERCVVSGPSVSCNIEFENNYDSPPLVFVMATVDASRSNFSSYTTEYPSDLRVMSVTNSSADIKQLLPPTTKACVRMKPNGKCGNANNVNHKVVTYVDAPMNDIDYLVIEPGVLLFDNGAKIVAGEVSFDGTYSNAGGGQNINKLVGFDNFGLTQGFDSSPGVLVQIQSIANEVNGQPLWLTPIALNPSRTAFSLVLDRSEVTRNDNTNRITPERVGFVAGLGQGFVNGRKFWLGQGSTKQTTTLNDNVIKPITEGCKLISPFSVSGFTSTPTLLASKRTRNGNNGGWLRRCAVSKTGVSLINEEDMTKDAERGHVVEPFSYFLFDKPPLSEVCELFPSPAQTWKTNSSASLRLSNQSNISGAPISEGKRFVGFKQENIVDVNSPGCDGLMCSGDSGLMVEKQELESFKISSEYINLWKEDRTFSNDEIIGTLKVGKGTATFTSGTYWIGEIIIDNGGKIEIPEGNDVTIHARKVSVSNNNSSFGTVGEAEFVLLIHSDPSITDGVVLSQNAQFTGLIYSESDVRLSNSSVVYGAVTANKIYMANTAQIIATDNHCFQPSDDYKVTMTPESDLSLMCGTDAPLFTVTTTNNGVVESLPITANVLPANSEGNFSIAVKGGVGTGTYPYFNTSSVPSSLGQLQLEIKVDDVNKIDLAETYTLEITMDNDLSKSDSSTIKYVPFKFAVDDQSVIAGKEYDVTAKVLACNDNGTTVVTSYTGTPTVTHTLNQPTSGVDGVLDYSLVFSSDDQGITQDTFTISESGLFTVKLTDSSFDCSGVVGCPIDGNGQLTGSFDVASRPWKFAVCTDSGSSGTSSSGDGFAAAGEEFDVYAKPIRYTDDATICNDSLVTENYLKSDASVAITHTLDTPTDDGSVLGSLNPNSELTKNATSIVEANKGYKFENLKYSEVGSFNFIATETGSFYSGILGGFSGSKAIGRFYPKYFLQIEPKWILDGQNDIAYLGQSYDSTTHTVYPMAKGATGKDQALQNYQFFADSLQANFVVLDDLDIPNQFQLDTGLGAWEEGRKYWELVDTNAMLDRWYPNPAITSTSRFNGPFNSGDNSEVVTDFGLTISGLDPVSFVDGDVTLLDQAFPVQPPARYGRMALDDIGGNSGATLTIPLRAEFWNGSDFEVNTDDDKNTFNGANYCKQVIWHSESKATTNASFNGNGTVSDGEDDISASQNTAVGVDSPREQARLWLRMDGSSPSKKSGENDISCLGSSEGQPWLRYNWRQLGDEDPSTVVTFGIYRGNDRVIYRGESGLTGQR